MADEFKRSYSDKSTSYDFYCSYRKGYYNRFRGKDKKMLHRLGRSRMKQKLHKELLKE